MLLVYYDSPPHLPWYPNSDRKMATELFEDAHSGLRKDAEEALKSMNSGLLLVSALISTINYAAVFALPGGFDSNRDSRGSGRPVLYGTDKERDLLLFLCFPGVALYATFLSLVEMVVIQMSKFASSDFFTALPFRYILTITSLYVSVVFKILAVFEAYDIIHLHINLHEGDRNAHIHHLRTTRTPTLRCRGFRWNSSKTSAAEPPLWRKPQEKISSNGETPLATSSKGQAREKNSSAHCGSKRL
ncbi:uncharacterized protein LOC131327880 [Rhododendron vialii]|uniref:uncharacterized protein LOC131327880 n=1 Tax=Rhododendron vialii TaxID=182163 RepID=UPI00265F786A|nr:uncharacterized protein LOC131327880 [Rhododendron vialii]